MLPIEDQNTSDEFDKLMASCENIKSSFNSMTSEIEMDTNDTLKWKFLIDLPPTLLKLKAYARELNSKVSHSRLIYLNN